jgi:hypothetical protein
VPGFVEVTTLPLSSTATHSDAEGQETAKMVWLPSTWVIVHVGDAAVGFVEVTTLPESSVATHSDVDGHETPLSVVPRSTALTFHLDAPPAGSLEVMTSPWLSTATQNVADGHETAWMLELTMKGDPRSMRVGGAHGNGDAAEAPGTESPNATAARARRSRARVHTPATLTLREAKSQEPLCKLGGSEMPDRFLTHSNECLRPRTGTGLTVPVMSEKPTVNTHRDLEHPDGSRTIVWVRNGRIRLAVLGSAAVLAASGASALGAAGDDQPVAPSTDQSAISK